MQVLQVSVMQIIVVKNIDVRVKNIKNMFLYDVKHMKKHFNTFKTFSRSRRRRRVLSY